MKDKIKKLPTLEAIKDIPFKDYPQDAKNVTVKVLHDDMKMDVTKIANNLGMHRNSIHRLLNMEDIDADTQWGMFKAVVKRMFEHKRSNLYARVLSHLDNKLDSARFYEAAGLAKILQDADREDRKVSIHSDKTMVFQVVKDNK